VQKAVSLYSQLRCFSSSLTCAKPQERSAGLNANPKNESCTKNEKIDALVVLSHVALLFEIFQIVFLDENERVSLLLGVDSSASLTISCHPRPSQLGCHSSL